MISFSWNLFTDWLTLQQNHIMVNRKYIRQILPYKDYFIQFKKKLAKSTLAKIYYVLRCKAGLTQEELALRVGTKKSYISRIENGKSDIMLNTLFRICSGLGKHMSIEFA